SGRSVATVMIRCSSSSFRIVRLISSSMIHLQDRRQRRFTSNLWTTFSLAALTGVKTRRGAILLCLHDRLDRANHESSRKILELDQTLHLVADAYYDATYSVLGGETHMSHPFSAAALPAQVLKRDGQRVPFDSSKI